MSSFPLPATQLAPLDRGRNDGIGRLARRTQRGQGRRRVLVAALIALSVLLGASAAIFAATMSRSDATIGVADRFGAAAATTTVPAQPFGPAQEVTLDDLTADQRAWYDAHRPSEEALTGDPSDVLSEAEAQAVGWHPVTVLPADVLARFTPTDEVLVFRTSGMYENFFGAEAVLVTDLDVTHPLAGSTFDTGNRTTPLTGDEALLSPSLLAETGAAVGDTIELDHIGPVEVVGTATRAMQRSQPLAIVAPGRDLTGLPGVEHVVRFASTADADAYQQAALEIGEARMADLPGVATSTLEAAGIPADAIENAGPYLTTGNPLTRDQFLDRSVASPSLAAVIGTTVTALATVVAAIVGACAFAVGVRRRIREIGMLGAVGAAPAQLRRLLRREGLVVGVGGALSGAALALLLAVPMVVVAERVVDRDLRVAVPLVGTLLPVVVGALGAYLAAAWPARTAARVPVVTALAGRVPLGRVPRWVPAVGLVAAVAGVLLLGDLVTGHGDGDAATALQLLGAVLLATLGTASLGLPLIAAGGAVADRLPLLGRLAMRDAARQRTRSAAAVAALVPVLALPVAGGAIVLSQNALHAEQSDVRVGPDGTTVETLASRAPVGAARAIVHGPWVAGRQVPPTSALVDETRALLPVTDDGVDVVRLGSPDLPDAASAVLPYDADGRIMTSIAGADAVGAEWAWATDLALATPELLATLGLAADAVPADGALLLEGTQWAVLPAAVEQLPIVQHDPSAVPSGEATDRSTFVQLGVLDVVRDDTVTGSVGPRLLVGEATADRLGLAEVARTHLLPLDRVPSNAEEHATFVATDNFRDGSVEVSAGPPFWQTPLGVALIGVAALLLVTLGVGAVAGMTSALAATESDDDVRKAVALGAEPALRRRLHGLQAWWHTMIAVVLGSALGLAVAWSFVRTLLAVNEYDPNGELLASTPGTLVVPWLPLAGWVLLLPVLVGLLIAAVMRPAPVGAPRRRTG